MSAAAWFAEASRAWLGLALLCALATLYGCSAAESSTAEPPSARCASCHLPEFQSTTHPPHPGVRPTTCGVCHGESAWHPARNPFLHSFPLEGGHAKPACFACHTGTTPQFEGTTHECVACHQKDQASANAKITHHDTFPSTCNTCHTINAWKPTLPHEEALAEPSTEPAPVAGSGSVLPASSTGSPASKPNKKPPALNTARPSSPTPAWSPDQVSGASRVKKR